MGHYYSELDDQTLSIDVKGKKPPKEKKEEPPEVEQSEEETDEVE